MNIVEVAKRVNSYKTYFKIMTENFSSMERQMHIQAHEAQMSYLLKRFSLKYTTITFSKVKDKEKILKAAREKRLFTFKGTLIRLTDGSSAKKKKSDEGKKTAVQHNESAQKKENH